MIYDYDLAYLIALTSGESFSQAHCKTMKDSISTKWYAKLYGMLLWVFKI